MLNPIRLKPICAGLLGCMLLTGIAEADVFVSVDAKGGYVLSNVHRPGRTYERVIHEPQMPVVSLDQQPQMIARQPYAELVSAAASANHLPEALLHAVINAESNYNPGATSPKGAGGLMQLMPDTARELGVTDVYDPRANIQGGARYLKRLMTLFDNDIALAVAAYNAGPEAVLSRGRVIPPFAETQRYVPSVLRQYRRLQGLAADAPL
ncbi:lytic transglycosylase domain-containing protein [Pseudomonas sp. B2M1-30]|uniref:lytic transglycosylase domain-containing protein n=1 Tax=Pseudomonas TaxID=286 RepID=UPI001C3E5290|nr:MULTISPECIES: lytic transglycosylase domain-containing protein [Pseudomonas]MBV4478173.1 lytic transglycosylase domain-containing protein [Pseudomonas botevensis]MCU0122220.1 lytic transglycosylase domain-containing protein [Pseudomonas sp. B2M1-30]MCU7264514.1 lytic transglycosylase domain-containing protein [Pseudomonas koreensis]